MAANSISCYGWAMGKETLHNLTETTKRFFSGTLLSRISGMGRDLAMAFAFGDHPSVAAFMVAFRFANLLRRLLGEGPFQSAFIPHFEGLRVQDPTRAAQFFRQMIFLMSLLLFVISLVAEGAIFSLLSVGSFSEGTREIISLTGWLFPSIIFICLYGLNLSLLNCYDSFFVPSVAPFICNTIWIFAAFFLRSHDVTAAMPKLAQFVVIGFAGQWLLTLPFTLKHVSAKLKEWVTFNIPSEVKQLARSFTLGVIGVGAVQINAFIDALFARAADLRAPVYLWYAIRFEQLALAIFGIACVTTIVPRLSRAIKSGDREAAQNLFSFSYRRIWSVMVPCTFALFALGGASTNLLYGHGHFLEPAISETTLCLWAYGVGLIPATQVILFSSLFYAEKNFRIPTLVALSSVLLNLLFNTFFVYVMGWGAISIALTTSLSAWINSLALQKFVKDAGWKLDFSKSRMLSLAGAGLFALLSASAAEMLLEQSSLVPLLLHGLASFTRSSTLQLLQFLLSFAAFSSGLILYATLFKNRDLIELFQEFLFKRKTVPIK